MKLRQRRQEGRRAFPESPPQLTRLLQKDSLKKLPRQLIEPLASARCLPFVQSLEDARRQTTMPPAPPATKTKTQAQHNNHEGTLEIPNNEAGTLVNSNPYVPPYAASASVDVAEASEGKTLAKTGATHNFTQAVEAYDTAAAAADNAVPPQPP